MMLVVVSEIYALPKTRLSYYEGYGEEEGIARKW